MIFQTEQGGELGQPDWNFRPQYKKCTLADSEIQVSKYILNAAYY